MENRSLYWLIVYFWMSSALPLVIAGEFNSKAECDKWFEANKAEVLAYVNLRRIENEPVMYDCSSDLAHKYYDPPPIPGSED